MARRVRHILSLSGGKDSTALAIYLRDKIPSLEYVFCDTDMELPETYTYLERLEVFLGQPITYLRTTDEGRGFEHWLDSVYRNYLPSPQARWCTRHLKIEPFEKYVGDDPVISYMGIRADENRSGYISSKPNIEPRFPFKEDGLTIWDVRRILYDVGLGVPEYYRWRSRSGCYFCFFQQKIEWIGLLEHHPDLFEKAQGYERSSPDGFARYTWNADESLAQLREPGRVMQIKDEHERRAEAEAKRPPKDRPLLEQMTDEELFDSVIEAYDLDRMCDICR